MELVRSLIEQARARGCDPAVLCRGATLTYSGLASAVARFARGLMSAGVSPGDRVCICLANGAEFVVAYYGAMAAGAAAAPLNPSLKESERRALMEMLAPRAVIERVDESIMSGGTGGAGSLAQVASSALQGHVGAAAILATSGSTGEPKGVVLTGKALLANAVGIGDAVGARPGQAHLVTLPLFHSFGATVSMNMPLATGGCLAIAPAFIPEAVAALAQSARPHTWAAVPAMLAAMAGSRCDGAALSSVAVCISGGAPLPSDVRRAFEAKFGIAVKEGYGLTEAGPVVSATRHDEVPEHGCVGRPIAGVRVRTECTGEGLNEPGRGELLVSGDGLMESYLGAPVLTAAVLTDGWLRTGDIASIDDEGRIRILDRACYVVNVGGFKVYPSEVEVVLEQHPCVAEALAVGVPDAVRGQAVAALVRLKPDRVGPAPAGAEIVRFARARLAAFKVPRVVAVVDELPRNDTGKLARARAIEIVQEAT